MKHDVITCTVCTRPIYFLSECKIIKKNSKEFIMCLTCKSAIEKYIDFMEKEDFNVHSCNRF